MSAPKDYIETEDEPGWILPEEYGKMTPKEQQATLRSCILRYLYHRGPEYAPGIARAIRAPSANSVRKNLQMLAAVQMVYAERTDSERTKFYPNGRLGHQLLQGELQMGRTEYAIRSYHDRFSGWNMTITESTISGTGERKPRGGIRLDLVDLGPLIDELQRIKNVLDENPDVIGRGLVTR